MLEVEITKIKGPIGKGTAKATVDGQLACSCELTLQFKMLSKTKSLGHKSQKIAQDDLKLKIIFVLLYIQYFVLYDFLSRVPSQPRSSTGTAPQESRQQYYVLTCYFTLKYFKK